jgi:hypothetical protein
MLLYAKKFGRLKEKGGIMKKFFYILLFCFLFSSQAFAASNIFCEELPNSDTSDTECRKISEIIYFGIMQGYANRMLQHKEKEGIPTTKEEAMAELLELFQQDTFFEYFQKCGESEKDIDNALECLLSNILTFLQQKFQ